MWSRSKKSHHPLCFESWGGKFPPFLEKLASFSGMQTIPDVIWSRANYEYVIISDYNNIDAHHVLSVATKHTCSFHSVQSEAKIVEISQLKSESWDKTRVCSMFISFVWNVSRSSAGDKMTYTCIYLFPALTIHILL